MGVVLLKAIAVANASLRVVSTGLLTLNTIGHGLAPALETLAKHAITKVDRLLFNPGIDVQEFSRQWVPYGPLWSDCVAVHYGGDGRDRFPSR
jgi:hypothetical protein